MRSKSSKISVAGKSSISLSTTEKLLNLTENPIAWLLERRFFVASPHRRAVFFILLLGWRSIAANSASLKASAESIPNKLRYRKFSSVSYSVAVLMNSALPAPHGAFISSA